MEQVFLVAVLISAFIGLILLGFGIRELMRRGDTEIGGLSMAGAWRRIGAVARATIAEGVRMKMAAIFIVVMLASMPLLAFFGEGDGTIKGRIQMFLGYVMGLTTFMLALMTLVLSTRSLASEITGRQIYGLAAKPIPRWQIIAGKWYGVTLLNATMLAVAGLGTYGGVRYIMWSFQRQMRHELVERGGLTDEQAVACVRAIDEVRGPGPKGVDSPIIPAMAEALDWENRAVIDLLIKLPEESRANLRRLDEVRRQVLVSRASLRPEEEKIDEMVEMRYQQLKQANELPENMTEAKVREELVKQFRSALRVIPPQTGRVWRLAGPPPFQGRDFLLSVRFKCEGFVPAVQLPNGMNLGEESLVTSWCVGDPQSPSAYFWPEVDGPQPTNAWVEFEAPTQAIDPSGQIRLYCANIDPRNVDAVFALNGLEVLYSAGTFGANIARAWLVLLMPLMLLAAMGVFFSTFCTFPVALLVTLVLYLAGVSGGFLAEAIGITADIFPEYPTSMDEFRRATAQVTLALLSVSNVDVSARLVDGRLLDWTTVGREAIRTMLLKSLPLLLMAVYIFRRRELAAIIV